ncbi:MAG: hypothetical protein J6U81_01140 [Bacteroidales bacterium]|nr:hypothetical protein [Bacteroidales bacterium]
MFKGYLTLYIHDVEDLNILIGKLRSMKSIRDVKRIEKSDLKF